MTTIEQEILTELQKLDILQKKHVLKYIRTLTERPHSVRDLMALPPEEREPLIAAAFELAADEDFEIFEAYSEENFDD